MQGADMERGREAARKDEIHIAARVPAGERPRGRDRRMDVGELFGGYQGPERRSGRERRAE